MSKDSREPKRPSLSPEQVRAMVDVKVSASGTPYVSRSVSAMPPDELAHLIEDVRKQIKAQKSDRG